MKRLDLIGQRFGRLEVKEFGGINKYRQSIWKCLCDCGNKTIVLGSSLKSGNTKSCGCSMGWEIGTKCPDQSKRMMCENNPNYIDGRCSNFKEYQKAWRKNNSDKVNAYTAKHRTLKRNQNPIDANKNIINLYHTICAYLNKSCEVPMWHVDHIQPISKGGLHHEDNLQILTAKLNFEKSAKWPLSPEEEIKYGGIRL